jgi:hypothetical protein
MPKVPEGILNNNKYNIIMKVSLNDLRIDLEDHKQRLKELKNKKIAKKLDDTYGIKALYLIPVYKRIISSIDKEIKSRTKK